MTAYLRAAATALLTIGTVLVLMFPERAGASLSTAMAYLALGAAVIALTRVPRLQVLMLWFAVAVVVAFQRAEGAPSAISHFTNLALGLLVFSVIAGRTWTLRHSGYLLIVLCGITAAFVAAGILLTDWSWSTLYPLRLPGVAKNLADAYVPGLPPEGANRNVVGGLGSALLPLALAVATAGQLGLWRLGVAAVALVLGMAGVFLSQSSAVAASVPMVLCVVLGLSGPRGWRWMAVVPAVIGASAVALLMMRPVQWLSSSDNLLSRAQVEGAALEEVERRDPADAETWRLSETNGRGRHGLSADLEGAPGLFRFTLQVKAGERTVVRLHSDEVSAVVDLQTSRYNDYGRDHVVIGQSENGWTTIDVVAPVTEAPTYVGIDLKDRFVEWGRNHLEGHPAASGSGLLMRRLEAQRLTSVLDRVLGTLIVAGGRAVESLEARRPGWVTGLALFRESPLLGIGLNAFRYHFRPPTRAYSGPVTDFVHAHNQLVQWALDVGLFGLVPLLGLHVMPGVALRRSRRKAERLDGPAVGLAGAALALVLFGAFDAIPLGAKVGIVWWMVWGAMFAITSSNHSVESIAAVQRRPA